MSVCLSLPCPSCRTQPGYSIVSPSSISLIACSFPATTRCPGWKDTPSASVCGPGYASPATGCSACARGYYPDQYLCTQCPPPGALKTAAIATFVGGLLAGVVCVVVAVAVAARVKGGKWLWGSAVFRGQEFITGTLFTWQSIVQVTKRAYPPPRIHSIYSALTVLQLVCTLQICCIIYISLPCDNDIVVVCDCDFL